MNKLIRIIFCAFIVSCSGYNFRDTNNPLLKYGIKSVAVPMFINKTSLAKVNGPFTKEIISLLNEFSGLRVHAGEHEDVDAILIGIIYSDLKAGLTADYTAIRTTEALGVDGLVGKNRKKFYVPTKANVSLSLRVLLIKSPNFKELEVIQKLPKDYVFIHPKVIFNETLSVSGKAGHVVKSGNVNFTKNRAAMDDVIAGMAKSGGNQFREVVINAF